MTNRSWVFAATLHDPDARFLPLLRAHGGGLRRYRRTVVVVTESTAPVLGAELAERGATLVPVVAGATGKARRQALRRAVAEGESPVFLCDFDRWLHWTQAFPAELASLPARVAALEPLPWYVCLGRTARAFQTHPRAQREPEAATNHALGIAVGQSIDAVAGASWLSPEGARLVLADSREPTAATDLEWPALIHRADPARLGFLACEGLEFETATFYADEVGEAGGVDAWIGRRYERPEVWSQRLRLAADSVAAVARVLQA